MSTRIELIVARSRNGVIGKGGQMPWHLPQDLKHFKTVTMGCPVIMGRKTHESIGRALPGRRNIVISRNPAYQANGCEVVDTLEAALSAVSDAPKVFIIGGDQIYRLALGLCQSAWVTEIDATVAQGDAFFDDLPPQSWQRHVLEIIPAQEATPQLTFCRYDRIA